MLFHIPTQIVPKPKLGGGGQKSTMVICCLEEFRKKMRNLSDTKILYVVGESSPKIWRARSKMRARESKNIVFLRVKTCPPLNFFKKIFFYFFLFTNSFYITQTSWETQFYMLGACLKPQLEMPNCAREKMTPNFDQKMIFQRAINLMG